MARELRALMYDNDAGEITRPDIPAALSSSPGEGDVRASGFHSRQEQERELAPYTAMPVLPSRLNEPTVPDAALKMSMARADVHGDYTPSDVGRTPRSGPRHPAPSAAPPPEVLSTIPPPARPRSRKSLPPDSARARKSLPPDRVRARKSMPPDSAGFAARARITAKATPVALREREQPSLVRAFLLVTGTAVVAAMLGVGLGNGSLERLFSSSPPAEAPPPALPAARVAPARVTSTPASAPARVGSPHAPGPVAAPAAAATDEAPKVPVLRIDQLPPGEASAAPEANPTAKATPKPARKAHR